MIAVGLVIVFSLAPGGIYVAESQGYWNFDVVETVPIYSPEGEPIGERPVTAHEKRRVTFIKKTEVVYLNLILLAIVLVLVLPLTRHVMTSVRGVGFSLYTIHVAQATVVVVWLGAVTISAVTGLIGSP